MIDAIIVDDESGARSSLRTLLKTHFPQLNLVGEAANVQEGVRLIDEIQPQLVFLDIEMPDGSGFDLLDKVKEISFETVFVTAFDQYAIRAFQCAAYGYLQKPVALPEMERALAKLDKHLAYIEQGQDNRMKVLVDFFSDSQRPIRKLIFEEVDGFSVVKLLEILYLEGDGNATHVYLLSGKRFTTSKTLKEYETLLVGQGFFRCHKSYLIHLSHVSELKREGTVSLTGGVEVAVSRRRRPALLERFT